MEAERELVEFGRGRLEVWRLRSCGLLIRSWRSCMQKSRGLCLKERDRNTKISTVLRMSGAELVLWARFDGVEDLLVI